DDVRAMTMEGGRWRLESSGTVEG
ncbi:hypothetical protein A2U01_0116907, partial [Trifolium medium]|nr:hypothetical protein [Trifolium medium]